MNIFIYHRPVHKEFYELLATEYFSEFHMITLSDFKNSADIWLGGDIANFKKEKKNIFSEIEKKEILLRCRFLRNIDHDLADHLIEKMSLNIDKLIKTYKPKFIIAAVIDNYTMDIMERLAVKWNIPYVSFLGHFFSGYSWITRRGELNAMPRSVSDKEVQAVLDKILNKSYIPNYHKNLRPTRMKGILFYLKQMIKKDCYLPLKKMIENDKWNYYYHTRFFENSNIFRIKDFVSKNIEQYFLTNKEITYSKKNVLLPLHFRPEATTDYWCDDPTCGSNYEDSVIEVIKNSSEQVNFLVKEHPTMYMKRQKQFYDRLLAFKNVRLIHPLESSNETLDNVEVVYVYTGSIGVEALLRNKLVISRSKNYYSNLHPNVYLSNYITDDLLQTPIIQYDHFKFVKDILQGTMIGNIYNNKEIMKSDKELIFKQVREYCDSLESENYEQSV